MGFNILVNPQGQHYENTLKNVEDGRMALSNLLKAFGFRTGIIKKKTLAMRKPARRLSNPIEI